METYKNIEEVQAVQVESVESNLINGDIDMGNTFMSQNNVNVGDWLALNALGRYIIMTDNAFNASYAQGGGSVVSAGALRYVQSMPIGDFRKVVADGVDDSVEFDVSDLSELFAKTE